MHPTYVLVALGASALASAATAADQRVAVDPDRDLGTRAWQRVEVLADDGMEGRRAGTPGHHRAAEYVAAEFARAGLTAGADHGFLEPVALRERTIDERHSSLALVSGGKAVPLTLGEDAFFSLNGDPAAELEASLVFAGYGLDIPAFDVDELTDLDLAGKVVVAFMAGPAGLPGAVKAHFGSPAERWRRYRAAGAVGMMLIRDPGGADLPWDRLARLRLEPQMELSDPALQEFTGQALRVVVNPARGAPLFAGTSLDYERLLESVRRGDTLPRGELSVRVRARLSFETKHVTSENVIGVLRGGDRERRAECVVLTAHLDHLGVAATGDSDRIFNGAMDNASGVAALIEAARRLHTARQPPARTIVFVAVTAEESGQLGSRYFVAHASSSRQRMVAEINSDMVLPLFSLARLIVFGLEESDLADDVRKVATPLAILIQSDPEPQRNRFIRSDQYSFIRRGIPSVALKFGFEPGSPAAAIEHEWFASRYHAPSDDPSQPVDLAAYGRYIRFLEALAMTVADRPDSPAWNPASIFAIPPTAGAGVPSNPP